MLLHRVCLEDLSQDSDFAEMRHKPTCIVSVPVYPCLAAETAKKELDNGFGLCGNQMAQTRAGLHRRADCSTAEHLEQNDSKT